MKMIFKTILPATIAVLVLASSCKDEPEEPITGTLQLKIELYNGTAPMQWNEIVSLAGMNEYRMDFFRFYLSHVQAIQGGNKVELKDLILADAAVGMTYNFTLNNGNYDALTFGIGLDVLQNASDPVTFPNAHPLSVAQGMYWSWAAKYRFIRLDGRANEAGQINSPDDFMLAYHPGADEFYREREFVKAFGIQGGKTTVFTLKLDVAAFYEGPGGTIDMPKEPQTHTAPEDYHIAEMFTNNFAAAFSIK